jgi:hypothetical protein
MNIMSDSSSSDPSPGPPGDAGEATTGLPWPRSWPGVYVFVFGSFLTWVVLLVVLKVVFS